MSAIHEMYRELDDDNHRVRFIDMADETRSVEVMVRIGTLVYWLPIAREPKAELTDELIDHSIRKYLHLVKEQHGDA